MQTLQSRHKSHKKAILLSIGIAAAIVAAACVYVYAFNGNILGWTNGRSPASDTQSSQPQEERYDPEKSAADTPGQTQTQPPPSSDTPAPAAASVTITSARQTQTDLQVRTLIASIQDIGECTLTLKHANRQPISETAKTQVQHNSSICQGFDIPLYKLVPGNWDITVDFKNSSSVGQAKTTITIN